MHTYQFYLLLGTFLLYFSPQGYSQNTSSDISTYGLQEILGKEDAKEKIDLLFEKFSDTKTRDFFVAKIIADSAQQIIKQMDRSVSCSKVKLMEANIYILLAEYDSSEQSLQEGLSFLQGLPRNREVLILEGQLSRNLGITYNQKVGTSDISLEEHLKAKKLFEEAEDWDKHREMDLYVGIVYQLRKKFAIARKYLSQHLEDYRKEEKWSLLGRNLKSISQTYIDEWKYDSASIYNQRSIIALEKSKDNYYLAAAYLDDLIIQGSLKNYGNINTKISKAKNLVERGGFETLLPAFNLIAGWIEMETGYLDKAIHRFTDLATSKDSLKHMYAHRYLAVAYKRKEDYKQAYKYLEIYHEERIEENKKRFDQEHNDLLVKHESEIKEQEILALKAEKQQLTQSKVLLGLSSILGLCICLLLYGRYHMQRSHSAQRERYHKELIDLKERSLTRMSLQHQERQDFIRKLSTDINSLKKANGSLHSEVNRILCDIKSVSSKDISSDQFLNHFEQVHPDFFCALTHKCDRLTSLDMKHCAFIRLNLSSKEVANILHVSPKSVQISRYRLKKKMGLNKGASLNEYISSI